MEVHAMRIIKIILAALGVVSLKSVSVVLGIAAKIGSFLAGPFLIFVIGCGIYCAVTANWKSLVILAVIGGAVVVFFMLLGLLLGAIDIGISGAKRQMKQ